MPKITDVNVHATFDEGPAKAVATVLFDDCFAVHGIWVIERPDSEPHLSFPSRKLENQNRHLNVAHPTSSEFRAEVTAAVLAAYRKKLEENEDQPA